MIWDSCFSPLVAASPKNITWVNSAQFCIYRFCLILTPCFSLWCKTSHDFQTALKFSDWFFPLVEDAEYSLCWNKVIWSSSCIKFCMHSSFSIFVVKWGWACVFDFVRSQSEILATFHETFSSLFPVYCFRMNCWFKLLQIFFYFIETGLSQNLCLNVRKS